MKTMKNVMLAGLFVLTLSAFANNEKVTTKDGNVTITQDNETIAVSVLNTQNAHYKLFIYSEEGTLVFKGILGSETSLGKAFDFQTAEQGTYTFKVVSNNGETFEQDIEI